MIYYSVDTEIRNIIINIVIIISIIFSFLISRVIDLFNINRFLSILISYIPLPSIYNFLFKKFDELLWKTPFINKLIKIPNLNGVWKGELRSSFKCNDPDKCICEYKHICSPTLRGSKRNECVFAEKDDVKCPNYIEDGITKQVKLEIIQTFTKISIISYNGKSESTTSRIAGFLIETTKYGENPMLLYEHYNKVDKIDADTGMNSHSGFNELVYIKEKKRLKGKYYNDENRRTFGKVLYTKNT